VIFMAYPSGKYDTNLQHFLRDTNFWAAVTTAFGGRHVLQDALIWDRVRIAGQLRLQDFAKLLGITMTAQRAAPQPTSTQAATLPPNKPIDPQTPTPTPSKTHMPPTATPSVTPIGPHPTPDGTIYPTRTPINSPLPTSTSVQSPLSTPAP
jgi:hypothetical protein